MSHTGKDVTWNRLFGSDPDFAKDENGRTITSDYDRGVEAMRAACIAAVENLTESINFHYRIDCEPACVSGESTDWSKHRKCDPIDDILAALREVRQ